MNDPWYILHAYLEKENTAKHRRCLSADKNKNNIQNEYLNENIHDVIEIENSSGKFIRLNQFTSRNKNSPLRGVINQEAKSVVKKEPQKKRSHTPTDNRQRTKQFTFGDNEDYIIDFKKSHHRDSRERGNNYQGNLRYEDTYDDKEITRRTYKEMEVWNSNVKNSEKSGRKSIKYSILNKTIGIPKSERNDDNVCFPLDDEIIQTIVISLLFQ